MRKHRGAVLAAIGTLGVLLPSAAVALPITWAFTATVTAVGGASPVAVDDAISGTLTYEAATPLTSADLSGTPEIYQYADAMLSAALLLAADTVGIDSSGATANGFVLFGDAASMTTFYLRADLDSAVGGAAVNGQPGSAGFRIELYDDGSGTAGPYPPSALPTDVFAPFGVPASTVTIQVATVADSYALTAAVDSLTLVPEPCTGLLFSAGLACAALARRSRVLRGSLQAG